MNYLFCAYRDWALVLYKILAKKYKNMILLNSPKKLTLNYVQKINPAYIFFPDWSWKVPEEIIKEFKCVCFHESNLPKFRGGSPIQNQIIHGIKKTKTTAFFMSGGIDEGDIILQKDLSLEGGLQEIFSRMIKNDYDITVKIINNKYKTHKQNGKPTFFKRRKPEDSELKTLDYPMQYIHNFIRMLADPYPNAFIRIGNRRIIFKSSKFDGKKLEFEGEIV